MSDIEYLYGNYSGKSALDKKIQTAEEILSKNKELQEDNLERLYDQENWNRLQTMNVKDMSWQDIELRNAIKKKYTNTNKSGSDLPKPEGYEPDNTDTLNQLMGSFNEIKQSLEGRGYQFSQFIPMSSLSDVLLNFLSVRDSLRGQVQAPDTSDEIEEESSEPRYTKAELLSTRQAIDDMLENGEHIRG